MSYDYDVENLDRQFRGVVDETLTMQVLDSTQLYPRQSTGESRMSVQLKRLHENLESHLRPFWSSALPSRTVRVSVYAHPSCLDTDHHSVPLQPVVTTEFCTGSDGYFYGVLAVTWDDIRTQPNGSLIAFDGTYLEHELEVHAHILEPNYSLTTSPPRAARIPITQSTV